MNISAFSTFSAGRAAVLALLLILPLSACGTTGKGKDNTVDIACPPVEVPAPLSSTSKGSVSSIGTQASANMRIVGSSCDVTNDKVTMKVDLDLTATRGTSLKQNEVSLPFFAAVVDQNAQLLNKKLYETTFTFSGDKLTDQAQLQLTFDLTKMQAATSKVYVGFQISHDAWQALQP